MENAEKLCLFTRRPNAVALVKGSDKYPDIYGRVYFYEIPSGVVVRAEIRGLPIKSGKCKENVLGFHIHAGTECSGDNTDAFEGALGHYNPDNCMHPYHAGDMPPLFSANGRAFSVFLTDKFTVYEILGRTVIIHAMPDDFMTQTSGNSGEKIACGVIRAR